MDRWRSWSKENWFGFSLLEDRSNRIVGYITLHTLGFVTFMTSFLHFSSFLNMYGHGTWLKPNLHTGLNVEGVYTVFPTQALLFCLSGRARIYSPPPPPTSPPPSSSHTVSKGTLQVLVHLLYQSVALVSPEGQTQRYRRMTGNLGTTLQFMFCVSM
jgi:hypothetical protein